MKATAGWPAMLALVFPASIYYGMFALAPSDPWTGKQANCPSSLHKDVLAYQRIECGRNHVSTDKSDFRPYLASCHLTLYT